MKKDRKAATFIVVGMAACALASCANGSTSAIPAAGPAVTTAPTTVPTTYPTTDPNGHPTTAPTTVPTTVPTTKPTGSSTPTPTPTATPTPTTLPANVYPMVVNNGSQLASQPMNVYVYGQYPSGGAFYYVSSLTGQTTLTSGGSSIPALQLSSGGQIGLPALYNARIYVTLNGGTLGLTPTSNGGAPSPPAPYKAGDPSINTVFDFLEYNFDPSGSVQFNLDLTQVDAIGLPWSFHWFQSGGSSYPELGLKPSGISTMASQLQSLPAPWPQVVQSVGSVQRIVNPQHLIAGSEGGQTSNPVVSISGAFMTTLIAQMYTTFSSNDLVISGFPTSAISPSGVTWYGRVANYPASPTLTFYNVPSAGAGPSNVVATYTGLPTAFDVLSNSDWFLTGTAGPAGSATAISYLGRWLSSDLIRDTFDPSLYPVTTAHPVCGSTNLGFPYWGTSAALAVSQGYYGGTTTTGGTVPSSSVTLDWYAALAHANAYNQAIYGFPDDDTCNFYASDFTVPTAGHSTGDMFVVTIHPF